MGGAAGHCGRSREAAAFAARGVKGLRIHDITSDADVGLGSFYNHFRSKEELADEGTRITTDALAGRIVLALDTFGSQPEAAAFALSQFLSLAR